MKKINLLKKLHVTAAVFLAFIAYANAQINDAYVRINESGQNYSCSFIVEIEDTLNTSQVEVWLGTVQDSSDVILKTFTFDASPPAGCTYSRNLLTLNLGVGTLTEQRTYYANVRVNSSGNWTSYAFITN